MHKNLSFTAKQQMSDYLSSFITSERMQKFNTIIENRTKYFSIVLENIFQSHNASAVLRSCDCFGVQDVHIIENSNHFEINSDIALGASKWLSLYRYKQKKDASTFCLQQLKDKGYRIVATVLHKDAYSIDTLPIDSPFALVFGTELNGLSEEAYKQADYFVKIPMYGFTESFNISVSAAISMFYFANKIRNQELSWKLTQEEKIDVLLLWMKNSIKKSNLLEQKFLEEYNLKF
ncbi:MAG: RNA methyltransferase [Lentimicrobiaceae bacterium]|nr:RNA methyltransferase [Lentimicrobiaceae bacterium]